MGTSLRGALVCAVLLSMAAFSSAAPIIESVQVNESIENVQTSPTFVQVDPTPPGPTYGGPYGFSVDVEGQNLAPLTPPTVAGPFTAKQIATSTHNGGVLVYNAVDDAWRYGSPNANDWGSPTLADLNSRFGQGVYTVTVNGQAIALNLSGFAFPNVPVMTLTGGTWAGGEYVVDVSHALTMTTNAFTAYGSHQDDAIVVAVGDFTESVQFHSTTPGSNVLTYTLPAFSLVAGQDYLAFGVFAALVDVEPNAALPGSLNFASYEQATRFVISAVPEPATGFMMLAGLVGLAFGIRRRAVRE